MLQSCYFFDVIEHDAKLKCIQRGTKEGSIKILEIPIIMEEGQAQNIAEILLYSSWQERNVFNLKLPIKYSWLFPGMTIAIFNMNKKHIVKIFKIKLEGLSI